MVKKKKMSVSICKVACLRRWPPRESAEPDLALSPELSCNKHAENSGYLEACHICFFCRIQTYLQSTKPIIDLYEEMGKVKKIDASKSVDEVSILGLPKEKSGIKM